MKKRQQEKKEAVQVFVDDEAQSVLIQKENGMQLKGHIRLRKINCGKKCSGCPHHIYKYAVWREGKKIKEKYLGVVKTSL